MKLGLENISALLKILDDPQEKYKTIHIAGTNGKGSTSAMIAAAFQSNGFTTGLYTSPHLVEFTERIKVNGDQIPREFVVTFLENIWDDVTRRKATFFEVTTALAFAYFAEMHCDVAVIETGLGGRLDATNVLTHPMATVVTSIGMDHQQYLGDTIEKIAFEKAGIMKHNVPAIINVQKELQRVFRNQAEKVNAEIIFVDESMALPIEPPFEGEHQRSNLRTAMTTLAHCGVKLDLQRTIDGIRNTCSLTGLRGRLETIHIEDADNKNVTIIIDAAHNEQAFERLEE